MAELIREPDMNNANPDEWRVLIQALQIFTGEMMIIGLTNMDNSSEPQIQSGSRFEVNGRKYKCAANEPITGTLVNNAENYIYAAPSGDTCAWKYSGVKPVWSPAKGGWYDGNNRAAARFYYASSGNIYGNKVILDKMSSINEINTAYAAPSSGGYLAASGSVNTVNKITLPPGFYYCSMKGGSGGDGGAGEGGGAGGAGAAGETGLFIFKFISEASAYICVGGNGGDGGGGSSSLDYVVVAGGGGAAGGNSFLHVNGILYMVQGGSGGGGGGRDAVGGGGGAGGFSIGGTGGSLGAGVNNGGAGVNNGGAGGNNGVGGYGGSEPPYSGENGGSSTKFTGSDGSFIFNFEDTSQRYAGGGAGAGVVVNAAIPGGSGGTRLQSTSDGYVRIYRVG